MQLDRVKREKKSTKWSRIRQVEKSRKHNKQMGNLGYREKHLPES